VENISYAEHEILSGDARVILSVWELSFLEAVAVFIPATMVRANMPRLPNHDVTEAGSRGRDS
jgi:hypothetical protein